MSGRGQAEDLERKNIEQVRGRVREREKEEAKREREGEKKRGKR